MKEIVDEIRLQFLNEAEHSPILMADLAKMEQYISENYSGRSLIELLQNADDAQSHRFIIRIIDDRHALVANDGRVFSKEDLCSLCRSGASTKKRKSNTIGFRGIGFKSVVNYSSRVMVYSGNLRIEFSKDRTKELLPSLPDVPLIRIPHEIKKFSHTDEIREMFSAGYTTVFLFETNNSSLLDEILSFDSSSLLFLKNVSVIEFQYGDTNSIYTADKSCKDGYSVITVNGNDSECKNEWICFSSDDVSFAFKSDEGIAVEGTTAESVVHSFMPTRDIFCIPCKINGDFSTDPSRTRVVCDDETKEVLLKAARYLARIFSHTVINGKDPLGIISVASKLRVNPLKNFGAVSYNDLFFDDFKTAFAEETKNKNFIIQPDWMDEVSFLELNLDGFLVTQSIINSIPGLDSLLKKVGFHELTVEELISILPNKALSRDARLCILTKLIDYTRFTMDSQLKKTILSLPLFDSQNGPVKTYELQKIKVDEQFFEDLIPRLADEQDFYWFVKKLNIPDCAPEKVCEAEEDISAFEKDDYEPVSNTVENSIAETDGSYFPYTSAEFTPNDNPISSTHKSFTKKGHIHKWRSIEQNVMEFFKDEPNVQTVKDVASMNLGYDIEVTYTDGSQLFVEVKSVNDLGDAFTMTNNEYSLANFKPDTYAIAVATSNDFQLEICLIKNPVNVLNLERRIVRWEWVCNAYEGKHFVLPIDD